MYLQRLRSLDFKHPNRRIWVFDFYEKFFEWRALAREFWDFPTFTFRLFWRRHIFRNIYEFVRKKKHIKRKNYYKWPGLPLNFLSFFFYFLLFSFFFFLFFFFRSFSLFFFRSSFSFLFFLFFNFNFFFLLSDSYSHFLPFL